MGYLLGININAVNLGPYGSFVWPAAALVVGLVVGFAVERFVLRRWMRLVPLRGGITLLFGIAATWIAVDVVHPPDQNVHRADQFLEVLTIAVITFVTARIAALAMHGYTRAHPAMLSSASLFVSIGRAVILGIGALIALGSVGVSITPVLTALGVGGLAVGLALQPTLANLFGGMQILAAGILRPGDFVRLATGQEGMIVDITWHSTIMRDATGALVIVPNTMLSSSLVTNMSSAGARLAVSFSVAVTADLDTVSATVVDAVRAHFRDDEQQLGGDPYLVFGTPDGALVPCTLCVHLTATGEPFGLRSTLLKIARDALRDKGVAPFSVPGPPPAAS